MTKRILTTSYMILLFVLAAAPLLSQRQADITRTITDQARIPRIAVPFMTGPPELLREVNRFNDTLWNDLESSAQFEMISKSFYPRTSPRRPEDLRAGEKGLPADPGSRGLWLTGWSQPPVTALYLVFGSLELSGERLTLSGYLYDVLQASIPGAHIFGKRYYATADVAGVRQLAHEFARDILRNLGLGVGLAGSRIYFNSNRTGSQEIWSMDYDGANQQPLTKYGSISMTPAVSPAGDRIAFTTYVEGQPLIYVHSIETNRRLTFYNQKASLNATPFFSPDGKSLALASTASGVSQIYMADIDGRNLRRVSYSRSLEIDPAINPKTGAQIAYVSGRSGVPQIYLMDIDGANVRMLSLGGGDAVQPAWGPRGENLAFSWTRGFEPGNYNVFVLNVATGNLVQLTHGAGRNENPYWSPSGTHLVFSSNRSGGTQIWTMRADGTQLKKLTSAGRNQMPVWGVK